MYIRDSSWESDGLRQLSRDTFLSSDLQRELNAHAER